MNSPQADQEVSTLLKAERLEPMEPHLASRTAN